MEKDFSLIFDNIDFYNRYKDLSDRTRKIEERLEKTDKQIVLEILENQNVSAKYVSKDQFYKIEDKIGAWDVNLHMSIKYGVVEVLLGGKNKDSGQIIGGPASLICESIEKKNGLVSNGYVKKPAFANYEVLAEIIEEIISIYGDFKKELLKLSLLT